MQKVGWGEREANTHTHTHARKHTRTHARTQTHTHANTHTHTHTSKHTHTQTHTPARVKQTRGVSTSYTNEVTSQPEDGKRTNMAGARRIRGEDGLGEWKKGFCVFTRP